MSIVNANAPTARLPVTPDTSRLLPAEVAVLSSSVLDAWDDLHAAERALVARAITKRKHEFATGRWLAHQLLALLGVTDFALLADADRAPLWPPGIIGSISHSHGLCVAAAARRGAVVGLGIDVEEADAVRPELWRRVLRADEERWLREQPVAEQMHLAAVFFSAKEAFYKAQFPLTRARLGFHDVALQIDPARGEFRARATGFAHPLAGAFAIRTPWVLTGLALLDGDLAS